MRRGRLIVLKFGGSVLPEGAPLTPIVHEIYRWRRAGWRVVAVVSAEAGETEALLEETRALGGEPDPSAIAGLLSVGELRTAHRLGLLLDRAGVPARVLSAERIGLVAEGDALDATPVALRDGALFGGLEAAGVVVVPGYAAHDAAGRPVVLGRGGSDLTALFVARRLGADRCRLVKDVDGLYEDDPRLGPARRYAVAGWAEALATDGSIVQPKAVRFARDHAVPFELGALGGARPTRIGPGPAAFGDEERETPIRVALLGLGTVGGGVRALLESMPDRFEIVRIAVRDTVGRRGPLTTDGFAAATCGADVVVEAIGGIEPARSAVAAALAAGSHVVTANKALLAADGVRLQRIAATHGRVLCGAAAVGGSVPVLERLAALGPRVVRVRGIVNGTCNFVLDRIARGVPYDVALTDARNRGLAECDPARDLDGRDSADKLAVMARTLAVDLDEPVSREAITAAVGGGVRQVATLDVAARCGRVELTPLAPSDPLLVPGAGNAVEITLDDGSRELLRGRGAGRWATAESVVGELLDLGRPSRRVRCSA